jgi:hypothetical protein
MRAVRHASAIAMAALVLAGCGLTPHAPSPLTSSSSLSSGGAGSVAASPARRATPGASQAAQADRTHEVPTPARRQTVVGGWRDPVQAVQVFTDTYINWTAATIADRLRALAEVSVGQARSAMTLAASQTAGDYELKRGGIGNSGVVEAVAPVAGRSRVYAVVTRELTTATNSSAYRGLKPTWHITLATVTRVQRGLWVLSEWQPES